MVSFAWQTEVGKTSQSGRMHGGDEGIEGFEDRESILYGAVMGLRDITHLSKVTKV